jgi:hypothetical protein
MEPLQLAALADSKSYFTTGSPRLNRRCERWPIAKCKNLTVHGPHAARGLAEAKKDSAGSNLQRINLIYARL